MRTARMLGLGMMAPVCLLFLGGCQRGPVPLVAVSGKVLFKNMPLPGGTIVFTPDTTRGGAGPIAIGRINSDGSFQLNTGEEIGATPGWYRVTVTSYAPTTAFVPGQPFRPPVTLIPEKYRDPELSQLVCEVRAGRANTIDFNLD